MTMILGFLFIFSLVCLLNLVFEFVKNLMSTPPVPFELNVWKKLLYGTILSYILTYLIYI